MYKRVLTTGRNGSRGKVKDRKEATSERRWIGDKEKVMRREKLGNSFLLSPFLEMETVDWVS